MNYQKELNLIKNITKVIYENTNNSVIKTDFKGEQDIVTSSDLYIEKQLISSIKKVFPDDNFHTEEYNNSTLLKDRTWIIDPIDGTSNYACGLGLFVIQIALYDKNDIVLSYVYAPILNKTYYAIKNEGAYLNDKKYYVYDSEIPNNFMVCMVGITHKTKDKTYFMRLMDYSIKNKYKLRMLGSIGLELALMSEGVFDMFYTNIVNVWDLYPGILLLREAGAKVLNESGNQYKLSDSNLFVCKNEEVKRKLIDNIL